MSSTVILASKSKSRIRMLTDAGISFEPMSPRVDEEMVKQAMLAEDFDARSIADGLAELKAQKIGNAHPGKFVIGCDQTLELDGKLFDKPRTKDKARAHLEQFRGKTHKLHSAVVIFEGPTPVYRFIGQAKLTMRPFSDAFLDWYLDTIGEDVLQSVGCYHLEGIGSQLFSRIEGDYFTVLGMPLLNVIAYLRSRSVLIE